MIRVALIASLVVGWWAGCKKTETSAPVEKVGSGMAPADQVAKVTADAPGSGSAGGEADPWTTPEVKKDPIQRPFLWSAEKDGKTSYLLGTIHIGVDAEQKLPQVVFDKLDASTTFAMETDTTDPALASMGKRTSGTLQNDLGPVYWKKLETVVGANVAQAINNMKPMIAATLLSLRGLPTTPPMDGVLHGRAKRLGKQIVYLETAASQAAVLEKHMTVKALKIMLDDPEKGVEQTKRLLDAYLVGDEVAFDKLNEEQRADALENGYTAAEYDQFIEDINYTRNANWVPTIEKLHADQAPVFIAVGALHLLGKRSVLDLLAQKGFKVTRVQP